MQRAHLNPVPTWRLLVGENSLICLYHSIVCLLKIMLYTLYMYCLTVLTNSNSHLPCDVYYDNLLYAYIIVLVESFHV